MGVLHKHKRGARHSAHVHKLENIQHSTFNFEHPSKGFGVGRWALNVECCFVQDPQWRGL
jgi:hypothetical protein